ncbi:MAG: hypothetical protein QM727_01620 [Niabella sp.]
MNIGLKFAITACFVVLMIIAGLYAYRYYNNKIMSNHSGWKLLLYAVLMIVVYGLIFFGGLLAMAYIYFGLAG